MPFGLTIAPATFQHFMNEVLQQFVNIFSLAFLVDILIFSDSLEEHRIHLRKVLQAIKHAGLFLRQEKWESHLQTTSYRRIILSTGEISMDSKKVETVREWETPVCVKDVHTFWGFANFYQSFILGLFKVMSLLTAPT